MSTEEQLSLFAAGSPASLTPLPGSKEALSMTEHSGRKCCESYQRFSPLGSLAKMFLESSTWNSTTCYLTWRPKVTNHNALYFQLAPSMPNIEEIASSLFHTPTAKANQMSPSELKKGSGFWATPNTMDHLPPRSPEAMAKHLNHPKRKGQKKPENLREQVDPNTMRMWPTPDASPRGSRATDLVVNESTVQRRKSGQKRGMDLQTAAKLWPTPTANLSGEADFMESLVTKDGKPAQPGERAYSPKSGKHTSVSLNRAVKMWPTPSARDHKGGYIGGRIRNGKVSWDTLNVAVQHTDNQEKASGSLNPAWVEWLMGFPIGHTDLED